MTSSGHIYKIICTLDEKFCYIGSTFNRLSKRFEKHRKNYKQWKKGDGGTCSCYPYFDKYGVENFKIILIKTYEVCRSHVKDRKHLEAYETLWINKTKCVNKHPAFSPLWKHKRYRSIQNKIEYIKNPNIKSRNKAYKQLHREQNNAKARERYDKNRDEINLKHKEYRDKNRDEINATQRERYAKNSDKILARRRELYAKKKAKKEAQITV